MTVLARLAVGRFVGGMLDGSPIPNNNDISTLGKTLTASLTTVMTGLAVNHGGCMRIGRVVRSLSIHFRRLAHRLVASMSHSSRTCSHIFSTFGLPGRASRRGTVHDRTVRGRAGCTTRIPVRITHAIRSVLPVVSIMTEGKGDGTMASTYISVVYTQATVLKTLLGMHVGLASVGSRGFIGRVDRRTSVVRRAAVTRRRGVLSCIGAVFWSRPPQLGGRSSRRRYVSGEFK